MKKALLPDYDVPIMLPNGQMNPVWYGFFTDLLRRGVLDMPDVDNSTPIANTQVLVYDGTAKKLKPGAN